MHAPPTFRVAIVGSGRMAARFHAPSFAAQPDCRIVACASRTPEHAESLARAYGGDAYHDVAEMIDKAAPDVVVIATADNAHLAPLGLALDAKKHVFVEKPLHAADSQERVTWADYESAVAVMRRWDRGRSIVGINFNYRTMPHYSQLRMDCASGELGTIGLVDGAAHLNCWSHTIDLLRWWCGDVSEVFAHWGSGESDLQRGVALRFVNGAIGTLVGARYDFRDELVRVEVYGTQARGLVRGLNGSYIRQPEDQTAPDTVWPRKDFGNDLFGPSFRASVDAFCTALRTGGRPLADGDDALAELAIEAAIHRSSVTNAPVRVPFPAVEP
jgi:myo-inositol 2-dehydrogenase/D-chiro-inositol 1-dehydrogenase